MKLRLHFLALMPLLFATAFTSVNVKAEPMNAIYELLDTQGGTRTGRNELDGYYVVAIGFSENRNKHKAAEESRMEALRQLNGMINGVTMSGSTSASMEYITVSDDQGSSEFSRETFVDVVNETFSGQLNAAKTLKSGKYGKSYYTAIVVTETDIKSSASLRGSSNSNASSGGNTIIIATGGVDSTMSQANRGEKVVISTGMAELSNGRSQARKLAIEDAQRNAIQQAQGVMLQGKSGRFNGVVASALSTKTEGYISNYELLDEYKDGRDYVVEIEATLDGGKLLHDVNFYTAVFGQPVFAIESENASKTDWMIDELETLGFTISKNRKAATHLFNLKQQQVVVKDANGKDGIQTRIVLSLTDLHTKDILFTIKNNPIKTESYLQPISRAKEISELASYKKLKKQIGPESIQALAKHAENGLLYTIEIKNAKRTDVDIFKHVLNNGTDGQVETWEWNKKGKVMTLHYRYSGALSEAMDKSLHELYSTFKTKGKGRRPHMKQVSARTANFEIVQK